jgi:hypothetical protein
VYPETVHASVADAPCVTLEGEAVKEEMTGRETVGDETVIVEVLVLVGSALLVAVTEYVPGVVGAVYSPVPLTVPPPDWLTDQFAVQSVDPVTVAVSCTVSPVSAEATCGDTAIETVGGGGGGGVGAVTVIVALSERLESAALVATTV